MLFLQAKNGQEITIEDSHTGKVTVVRIICHSHPDLTITVGIDAPRELLIKRPGLEHKVNKTNNQKNK